MLFILKGCPFALSPFVPAKKEHFAWFCVHGICWKMLRRISIFWTALNFVFCCFLSEHFASFIQNATSYGLELFFFKFRNRNKKAKFRFFNTIIEPILTSLYTCFFLYNIKIANQIIAVGCHWSGKNYIENDAFEQCKVCKWERQREKKEIENKSWMKHIFWTKPRACNKQKLAR